MRILVIVGHRTPTSLGCCSLVGSVLPNRSQVKNQPSVVANRGFVCLRAHDCHPWQHPHTRCDARGQWGSVLAISTSQPVLVQCRPITVCRAQPVHMFTHTHVRMCTQIQT